MLRVESCEGSPNSPQQSPSGRCFRERSVRGNNPVSIIIDSSDVGGNRPRVMIMALGQKVGGLSRHSQRKRELEDRYEKPKTVP